MNNLIPRYRQFVEVPIDTMDIFFYRSWIHSKLWALQYMYLHGYNVKINILKLIKWWFGSVSVK